MLPTSRTPRRQSLLLMASLILGIGSASAQISLTTLGAPLSQNFDTLATTGTTNAWTDNTVITGWYAAQTAGTLSVYRAGDGTSNAGAIYSFGTGAAAERALGSAASGTPQNLIYAARYVNNTGATLTALDVAYTGEQWRNGGNATAQKLDFQYQIANAGGILGANNPAVGWIDVNTLDFTGPIATAVAAALDGNLVANQAALSVSIPLTVNPGQEVWIRWFDTNDAGNDHGLGIDNVSVTPQGVLPLPNLTINDVNVVEGDVGTGTINFVVTLSAPAPTGGVTFDITTADGTALAGSDYVANTITGQIIAAGNSTFTFNVGGNGDTLFENNETFFVNVSNVVGAVLTDGQGLGTFINDDAAPTITLGSPSMAEGNVGTSVANVGVTLSAVAGIDITVAVNTADGTATVADNDYVAAGSNVLIPAGSLAGNFPVTINGDTVVESDETITVSGLMMRQADAVDGMQLPPSNGTITLLNDDTASELSLSLTAAPDPVFPGGTLTYTLNGNNAGPDPAVSAQVTINFTTQFVSLSAPGWTCGTPAVGFGGVINCTLASLPLGAFQFILVTTVPSSALPGEVLGIDAALSSASNDAIPANNTAGTTTTVVALPSIPAVAIPVLGGVLTWLLVGLMLVSAGLVMPRHQR